MQTSPKLSQTALMVGAAAVALRRRSIDAGAWRALAAPPACLPAARDSVDARVLSFGIACANLAGHQLMNERHSCLGVLCVASVQRATTTASASGSTGAKSSPAAA
jgi:hypothetical protein